MECFWSYALGLPQYDAAWGKNYRITHVSQLGAQHLLAVAALYGVVPLFCATRARFCIGTMTHKKMLSLYRMCPHVLDQVIGDVSRELGLSMPDNISICRMSSGEDACDSE
jgi:hypothetical protein